MPMWWADEGSHHQHIGYAERKKEKMKEVTSYQTTDEKLFSDKKEAEKHQAVLDFKKWYENNDLYSYNSSVDVEQVIEWIDDNSLVLTAFINR